MVVCQTNVSSTTGERERSGEREQKTVDECDMMHMIERGESAKQGNPFLRKEGRNN